MSYGWAALAAGTIFCYRLSQYGIKTDYRFTRNRQVLMKLPPLRTIMERLRRDDARASTLAVGSLLVIGVLYATTIAS